LNPARRRVLRCGPSRERTANGRAVSGWPATGYISCDRRKGLAGHVGFAGVRGFPPQREPALPTETAREQSTRGQVSHPFGWRGLDRSPVAWPPGNSCSPANGLPLRSLDDVARSLRVLSWLYAPVLHYDLPKASAQKNLLGCLRIEYVIRTTRASRNWFE